MNDRIEEDRKSTRRHGQVDFEKKWWNVEYSNMEKMSWKTLSEDTIRCIMVYYGKIAFMEEDKWIKQYRKIHVLKCNWLEEVYHAEQKVEVGLDMWGKMPTAVIGKRM